MILLVDSSILKSGSSGPYAEKSWEISFGGRVASGCPSAANGRYETGSGRFWDLSSKYFAACDERVPDGFEFCFLLERTPPSFGGCPDGRFNEDILNNVHHITFSMVYCDVK